MALNVPGVAHIPAFAGFSGATQTISSNSAALYIVLQPFPERIAQGRTADRIAAELRQRLAIITDASILVVPPPPVSGIGSTGGFAMSWQRSSGDSRQSLVETAMFRYKTVIGRRLHARTPYNHRTEAKVAGSVLNRMTDLGMPVSARIR
jgi:multidrug efflux pump subunit AcrB